MIFTTKSLLVPFFERIFQGKVKEVAIWVSLEADTTDNLMFCATRLILQKEVMFKQRKVGVYDEIGLTQMNKDHNLEDGVRVEMS
jgi:hypothetical protein